MSNSKRQRPPEIKHWTKEDVRDWLVSDVKVHPSYADIFFVEDVCGECLVDFGKSEILDLKIKHGPAVKITYHLKQCKEQSKAESRFPAYLLRWSKEQVNRWLLQYVKLYEKSAQRLLEEEVSGDCLVCFEKQDFKDLDIKQGPAVRILKELERLRDKPEPVLQTIASTKEEAKDDQPGPSVSELELPTVSHKETPQTTTTYHESPQIQNLPRSQQKPPLPPPALNTKTTVEVSRADGSSDNIMSMIYNVLNDLDAEEMKTFCFHLKCCTSSKCKPIPHSQLQSKAQRDVASLLYQHYVKDAPRVTVEALKKMNKNKSALELEKSAGSLMSEDLQSKNKLPSESDQGEKLKNLLTCGGNTLDNYNKFVIVLNKSHPNQVKHLSFLTKLKLFCVLDFDPNSVCPGGVCHSYRKERIANLHSPSQYQETTEVVIKNLNLHKQTSWVFCNGRNDLEDRSHRELDYKTWLKTSYGDVAQLVSLINKPKVLCYGEILVIFLLLSPVETEKDSMFETYKFFFTKTSEKNIVTLCESKTIFSKWKELIHENFDTDIDPFSIYELSLSEINGTILALGPLTTTNKLLPSSDSTCIVLKQKDEDLMTALEILCVNQCENIYDESSEQFRHFKLKQEEEFYRGGRAKWWNFYFCDKDKERPFIKRDKYENVKTMIRIQVKNLQNTCVLLTLYHHPGCGATTLAMHVLWDLRKELRCAVLKDNQVSKEQVAHQVLKLIKLENEKPCTVLLLVDDSKESDTASELVNVIQKIMFNMNMDNGHPCKVIILNCVRCHSPKEQYRESSITHCQYLTASLTTEEQQDFERKLKDLEKTHKTPENFYSFMLMKSNFDPSYTHGLASNTLVSFDISTKEAKLFAFLSLLNTYVADSEISLSLCEDFLGCKMVRWQEDSVLNRMAPYSNLLIKEVVEDWGEYKGVRILHNQIAAACLEELEKQYELKVSDITTEILHCDLFYSSGVVKSRLMIFIEQMLIERQRKKDGEREPFSPLVKQIHNQQGRQTVQEIFVKASSRFETSASIPQALARYLYIKEQDFPEALKWAQKARNITENAYTLDTIAQVYKSNLKHNMEKEKHEKSHNPEDLEANLKIAVNAISVFEKAQELARFNDTEEEPEDGQDYPRKSYTIYGYVGVVEITFLVFEIISRLPFFQTDDLMNKMYLRSFLERNISITSVPKENNDINDQFMNVIRKNEHFLQNLKNHVKETFEILEWYFTYLKANCSEFDSKNRRTVCAHFKKYVTLFCTEPEQVKKEQHSNPQLALKIGIEQQRLFLEEKNADTFSGILQHLETSAEEMEQITQAYAYLHKHKQFSSKIQATKVTTNYILSNIILHLSNPKSKHVHGYKELSDLLQKTLQEVGLRSNFPDLYYTALLLLWPDPSDTSTDIQTYVTAIRHSSRKLLSVFHRSRSTVAHLYLAKGLGLKRLVSKLQLDNNFKHMSRNDRAQLWRSGDIFKEKSIKGKLLRVSGTIEEGEVYARYGKQKVQVRPALIGGTRSGLSTEKVSFFLGFAINGPLAYDIKNEN